MTEDLGVMSDTWTGEDRYVNCIVTHNVCARDLTPDPAPDTCYHITTPTGTLLTLVHIYLRLYISGPYVHISDCHMSCALFVMWATHHTWWCDNPTVYAKCLKFESIISKP